MRTSSPPSTRSPSSGWMMKVPFHTRNPSHTLFLQAIHVQSASRPNSTKHFVSTTYRTTRISSCTSSWASHQRRACRVRARTVSVMCVGEKKQDQMQVRSTVAAHGVGRSTTINEDIVSRRNASTDALLATCAMTRFGALDDKAVVALTAN